MHLTETPRQSEKIHPRALYVDDDSAFEELELPAEFTSPRLDTDPERVAAARTILSRLARTVLETYGELELVERALRQAEPYSARARIAREHIRCALAGMQDDAVQGVDRAVLAFHRDLEPR